MEMISKGFNRVATMPHFVANRISFVPITVTIGWRCAIGTIGCGMIRRFIAKELEMARLNRVALLSTLSLIAFTSTPAFAQEAEEGAAPAEETIIVTGTRRTDRTVADSTVPIDVFTAESLTQSGFTETNRLLAEQIPSFNFPQPSITDGTDVIRPATLRGLTPIKRSF